MTSRLSIWLRSLTLVAGCGAAGAALSVGLHTVQKHDDSESANPRDALRAIVQEQCLVHWREKKDAAPCERVAAPESGYEGAGYAVLADRKGGAHYLLIPLKTMAGVDASDLLDPATPNFFSLAWQARDELTRSLGHEVPRAAVGLAANNAHSRSQDQFHIHIECLRQDVAAALLAAADHLGSRWSTLSIGGADYQALRVMGEDLGAANPYELLADQVPDARHRLGDYTFVVAGMNYREGPGFAIVTGTGPTGELLLDANCFAAGE